MTSVLEQTDTLAGRVEETVAGGPPEHSLRHHQLRFIRTIALSVGIQGPVAGVIVGPAVLAGIVGGSGALAYLLGLVAMGFVAYAFVIFSRSFNSAGSVYAFNGAALGPTYGFISAWILLLVYVSFAAGVYASTADITQTLFSSFGVNLGWVWFAVAGFALTMVFAYRSIRLSTIVIFACEGVAVVLLTIVGVVVLAKGGYHHHASHVASGQTMTRSRHDPTDWETYLSTFHQERPGITEEILAGSTSAGQNPYQWLLEVIRKDANLLDLACGSAPLLEAGWKGSVGRCRSISSRTRSRSRQRRPVRRRR